MAGVLRVTSPTTRKVFYQPVKYVIGTLLPEYLNQQWGTLNLEQRTGITESFGSIESLIEPVEKIR